MVVAKTYVITGNLVYILIVVALSVAKWPSIKSFSRHGQLTFSGDYSRIFLGDFDFSPDGNSDGMKYQIETRSGYICNSDFSLSGYQNCFLPPLDRAEIFFSANDLDANYFDFSVTKTFLNGSSTTLFYEITSEVKNHFSCYSKAYSISYPNLNFKVYYNYQPYFFWLPRRIYLSTLSPTIFTIAFFFSIFRAYKKSKYVSELERWDHITSNTVWAFPFGIVSSILYLVILPLPLLWEEGIEGAERALAICRYAMAPFGDLTLGIPSVDVAQNQHPLWKFSFGSLMAFLHYCFGFCHCLTLVTIPIAFKHFSTAKLALNPFANNHLEYTARAEEKQPFKDEKSNSSTIEDMNSSSRLNSPMQSSSEKP
jgi:uncharacterized membrane protein YccF (DUF307 family)